MADYIHCHQKPNQPKVDVRVCINRCKKWKKCSDLEKYFEKAGYDALPEQTQPRLAGLDWSE